MALYRATEKGNILMTAKEEADFIAEQSVSDSLPSKKLMLRTAVNDQKKKRESVGVNVGGVVYSTDFAARLELCNAYTFLVKNPESKVHLETKTGEIVELDKSGIDAVFDAVNNKIALVAAVKRQHFENIRLLNKDNISSYDVNGLWPL